VVLQSCIVSPEGLPGLSGDLSLTSSNNVHGAISIKVEGATGKILKEEDTADLALIKEEHHEVSKMSMCLLLYIFRLYAVLHAAFVVLLSQSVNVKQLYIFERGLVMLLAIFKSIVSMVVSKNTCRRACDSSPEYRTRFLQKCCSFKMFRIT
jgi:hypothetical protein